MCPSRCCIAAKSYLYFRVLHTSRMDKAIIAIPPRPVPTHIPAIAPVERPEEGSTKKWTAETIFTTADVGLWLGSVVEELAAALVILANTVICCS
jgi:hypothetical protein